MDGSLGSDPRKQDVLGPQPLGAPRSRDDCAPDLPTTGQEARTPGQWRRVVSGAIGAPVFRGCSKQGLMQETSQGRPPAMAEIGGTGLALPSPATPGLCTSTPSASALLQTGLPVTSSVKLS